MALPHSRKRREINTAGTRIFNLGREHILAIISCFNSAYCSQKTLVGLSDTERWVPTILGKMAFIGKAGCPPPYAVFVEPALRAAEETDTHVRLGKRKKGEVERLGHPPPYGNVDETKERKGD